MADHRKAIGFFVCVYLCLSRAVFGDPVLNWNQIAYNSISTAVGSGRPTQVTPLDFAMVHAAVYDAVEAFDKRFEPYHVEIPGASGAPEAAVAKAAHDVLVNLFPDQTASLDTSYANYLTTQGLATNNPGVFVGQQAAAGILNLRQNDGRFANVPPFTGGTAVGKWRPTPSFNLPPGALAGTPPGPPPSFASMAVPWLANVVPFTLTSPSQFRADPPPPLASLEYTDAYNEVKSLGLLSSTVRTAAQTELGYFYADNFVLLWNRSLRSIAAAHVNNLGDSARLFALVYLAMADADITAWDSKLHYVVWRPITAIREGNNDGNPRTTGDPDWKPLINTPNYPTYTSGANNVTGSITEMLRLFFHKDKITFTVTSNYPLATIKTRTYERFSDAADDVVNVRIYQGIHFRFDDTTAREQGSSVSKWVFKHYLRPLHGDDDDQDDDDQGGDDDGSGNRR